jgi:signal transduction histidine kinase
MDTLINGLLQVSRTGRVVMSPAILEMNKLFKSILTIFDYQLKEMEANVVLHELDDCYGDTNQLNQLFSNIIGNALKYSDKNRILTLEISSQTKYNKVIYSIKDNGIGINNRHLQKIWDVFYRVDASAPEAGEGLGLSLAKRIVDKHKGKIWAESVEGEGSTFYVELHKNKFEE